ncbi:cytochrome c oxidase subunit 2A [Oceanobacillus sp. FSL W8-0428]|nr:MULTISPECIES: cytochrome c oxidase subunit 2A [Oceanobacillus]
MKKSDPNLKGTLFSVITIGAIILISWFAVFLLFLSR